MLLEERLVSVSALTGDKEGLRGEGTGRSLFVDEWMGGWVGGW